MCPLFAWGGGGGSITEKRGEDRGGERGKNALLWIKGKNRKSFLTQMVIERRENRGKELAIIGTLNPSVRKEEEKKKKEKKPKRKVGEGIRGHITYYSVAKGSRATSGKKKLGSGRRCTRLEPREEEGCAGRMPCCWVFLMGNGNREERRGLKTGKRGNLLRTGQSEKKKEDPDRKSSGKKRSGRKHQVSPM